MKIHAALAALFAASSVLGSNVLAIGAATQDGETITIGSQVFEIDTDGAITAGRIAVDLTASAAARAAAVLTTTGNAVADETVTLGARVYTWKADPVAANQVKVGANASESLDNLVAAINGAAGAGTLYGVGTAAHALGTAAKTSASVVTFTARTKGTAGNALASTETMTNATFGGATLAGGTNPTAAESIAAIVQAINLSDSPLEASPITGGLIVKELGNRGALACSETLAGGGNAWQAAALTMPVNAGSLPNLACIAQRTVTAAEVTAGSMFFALASAPTAVTVSVRASTGVAKAWNGAVNIEGNVIVIDNTGATDFAANDIVVVTFAV